MTTDGTWQFRLSASSQLGLIGGRLGQAGGHDLLDHLRVLCALRTVSEMGDPTCWAPFVSSLSGVEMAGEREPRLTPRHPLDDYAECPPHAACDYVCLGCPTPRILLQNVRCGRCGLRAVMPTLEYGAMIARIEEAPSRPATGVDWMLLHEMAEEFM